MVTKHTVLYTSANLFLLKIPRSLPSRKGGRAEEEGGRQHAQLGLLRTRRWISKQETSMLAPTFRHHSLSAVFLLAGNSKVSRRRPTQFKANSTFEYAPKHVTKGPNSSKKHFFRLRRQREHLWSSLSSGVSCNDYADIRVTLPAHSELITGTLLEFNTFSTRLKPF